MLRRLSPLTYGLALMAALAPMLPVSGFSQADSKPPIKLGIIGLDTSHVMVFTKAFNDPTDKDHVAGFKVVAAYKGGSPDVEESWKRVDKFTEELRDKWNVEIVSDIPTLCSKVDAVLLESVDGRPHLEQVRPVFAAHKPVFIDKPLAGSYKDAKEIFDLGKAAGVPWFTASSLRFWRETERLKNPEGIGQILGFDVLGPTIREPHVPALVNYGDHAVEMLYQLMGPGCESVTMQTSGNQDVVGGKVEGWPPGSHARVQQRTLCLFDHGLRRQGRSAFGRKDRRLRPAARADCEVLQHSCTPCEPFGLSGKHRLHGGRQLERISRRNCRPAQ